MWTPTDQGFALTHRGADLVVSSYERDGVTWWSFDAHTVREEARQIGFSTCNEAQRAAIAYAEAQA